MKCSRTILKLTPVCIALSMLTGCAGSGDEQLEIPTNLPPICRDIDFSAVQSARLLRVNE